MNGKVILSKPSVNLMKAPAYIEDTYYTKRLLDTLTKHYLRNREKTHVSDLVGTCPRKIVFQKLDKHRTITERELMYFWDGEAVDEKLRKTFMDLIPGNYDTRAHHEYGPIVASPDLVDLDRKTVIELKTTDPKADTFLPKMHNMFQLMAYMAVLDYADGVLWYHIITRKKPDGLWREFHIHLNDAQRADIRAELLEDAQRFEQALEEENPHLARHVADDPTLNTWMCTGYCPYYKKCIEGFKFVDKYFIEHPEKKKKKDDLLSQLEDSIALTKVKRNR